MSHVEIYADGACRGNPGPGGWAALLILGERRKEISGSEDHTTNNRMELLAAINGLEALKKVPTRARVYTDGACRGNPGPGGWGALLISGEHRKELSGSEDHTTNNRMELLAAIRALEALKNPGTIARVYTDSQYVIKGMSEWVASWKKRGWKTADKKPVKNQDLWERLDALAEQHDLEWHWVRGHSGVEGNERVDQLANEAIDAMLAGTR